MNNSTPNPAPSKDLPPDLLISPTTYYVGDLPCCPRAQTLTAYSLTLHNSVIVPLSCRQWDCPYCARRKIRELAARTLAARPNRMMTLTVDPKLWASPRDAFDATRRQIAPLMRTLRNKFGAIEYLRVTELHKSGFPHYHFLLRSAYIPQPCIKTEWQRLTGAQIVDIRKIEKKLGAYTYLVKYLAKQHRITWTDRHVSTSAHFFPPKDENATNHWQLQQPQREGCHPYTYLATRCDGRTLRQHSPFLWELL